MPDDPLAQLQSVIEREIPICQHMGIRVQSCCSNGLSMAAPLDRNRNHQRTAFAGSLNALCTVTGWGSVFLLLLQNDLQGDIVIRRSAIKYLKPVDSTQIVSHCAHAPARHRDYFVEMLRDKGQSKIELQVEIRGQEETAVSFSGSYVVSGR